mgnify:FL=1
MEKAKLGNLLPKVEQDQLVSQWDLVRGEETFEKRVEPLVADCSFEEGSWSPLLFPSPGKAYFFHVMQKLPSSSIQPEELEKAAQPKKQEALNKFFAELIEEMQAKKAFSFEGDVK